MKIKFFEETFAEKVPKNLLDKIYAAGDEVDITDEVEHELATKTNSITVTE